MRWPLAAWVLIVGGTIAAPTPGAATPEAAATPAPSRSTSPRPPNALAVADPIHADLEALAARGALRLISLHARPLLRHDVALALVEALQSDPALAGDPTFRRALRAFAPEIGVLEKHGIGLQIAGEDRDHPQPVLHLEDEDNWLRVETQWRVEAEAAPDRGFVLTDSTRFGIGVSWIVWPGFHLYEELYVADIENGRQFGDPLVADTDVIIFQDRVYAGLATRYADLIFGRDRLAWGSGGTGSLLLSPTARPFTHVRISRSFFGGVLNAVIVNGVLNRAEGRYVAFHRLDWQPMRQLRLGLAEGARYNGNGFEPLYLAGIIPYPIVGRLLERDNDVRSTDEAVRNNVMWDADFTVTPRSGVDLYGEILIDDLGTRASNIPTRLGYQMGGLAVLPASDRMRELRLRLEWTRIWNYTYSTYYGMHFDHEGLPLGYPEGPDSRVLHARGDLVIDRDWTLSGILERVDHGEGRLRTAWDPNDSTMAGADPAQLSGIVERQWRLLAGCRYAPRPNFEAMVEIGPAIVVNPGNQALPDRRGLTGRVGLAFRR